MKKTINYGNRGGRHQGKTNTTINRINGERPHGTNASAGGGGAQAYNTTIDRDDDVRVILFCVLLYSVILYVIH